MAAPTNRLALVPPEVVDRIAKLIPANVALLAAVNTSIRTQSGAAAPKWPRVFHVFLDAYMQASDSERRESMLAALEAQATRFSLTSIKMPDFELDAAADDDAHPPMLAPERGAVRLEAVSEMSCFANDARRNANNANINNRCCAAAPTSRRSTWRGRGSTGGRSSAPRYRSDSGCCV
jgi:hypothetical protein